MNGFHREGKKNTLERYFLKVFVKVDLKILVITERKTKGRTVQMDNGNLSRKQRAKVTCIIYKKR